VDLTFTDAEAAFRAECRAWLEAHVPHGLASGDTREGFAAHLAWERQLAAARWAVVSWPEEYGGRGASPMEWLIFEEEYYRAGAPQRVTQNGIFLLAPTVFEFGTKAQQDRILPRMAAAQDLWCQGWSEPNAGSDLAAIESRAVRDDANEGWRLSGQKTWTTRGAFCTHLFGLFRTDPTAERHRGLTYFLVPLATPGITVRGFGRLDGDEGFAEVFFDDVFVHDDEVLGEVHHGWGVAMAAGEPLGAESSLTKVFWSELDVRLHEHALTLLGPHAELEAGAEPDWIKGYQFALSGPIYAGTNEIQRNVIAERVLGLPRR
jgi:alkylation response protein AidB-like acyl-CoA dehydrogenase